MKDLTLVILAAGMGSRYGGLKQIDKFGKNGEAIIDFSIYDAIQAGFNKLVLIIREEHEAIFEAELVGKIRPFINVEYAFQSISDVPEWFEGVEGREKPWGTTHALLAARNQVSGPFMIINADDYYGKAAFVEMARFLNEDVTDQQAAMMGYIVDNTITDNGTVTRGVCKNVDGFLTDIVETDCIKRTDKGVVGGPDETLIADGTQVSMNFWGFTPAIFDLMESKFETFLKEDVAKNPMKSEALLPNDVGSLINDGKLSVKILDTPDRWFGVTYQEDKPMVLAQFAKFQEDGTYPEKLWDKA
ncbi:sugar phosphate nucleotidyltransferase [Erysipelothrix rhusiopathiae]|uniref:nucleotidyltransferase family protein n=1 Tax=Erysipelothrix rhusiopathiae TaxID=1648 RepID=UPI0023AF8226|nr:sugar phosphate nucleotidyltransferase [Erysipelothrix rhusiopathiae]MDE8220973.1 sugar phosphate nucleotidyltransferase [Erysipelothrix rhusiopathiae]